MQTPLKHILDLNWTRINYDNKFNFEIRQWIEKNMNHNWSIANYQGWVSCFLYFEDETDAMAFVLRWT